MKRITFDEYEVLRRVEELRRQGFPKTGGYYLVIVSPTEAKELIADLGPRPRIEPHPEGAKSTEPLLVTTKSLGGKFVATVGDGFIISIDYTARPRGDRIPPQSPRGDSPR